MGAASSAGDTDLRRAPRVDAAVRGAAAASASCMVAGVCASDARRRVVRACVTADPGASASGTTMLACVCIVTRFPLNIPSIAELLISLLSGDSKPQDPKHASSQDAIHWCSFRPVQGVSGHQNTYLLPWVVVCGNGEGRPAATSRPGRRLLSRLHCNQGSPGASSRPRRCLFRRQGSVIGACILSVPCCRSLFRLGPAHARKSIFLLSVVV